MTTTALAGCNRPFRAGQHRDGRRPHRRRPPALAVSPMPRTSRSPGQHPVKSAGRTPASPPGAIGGAVIAAARRSAGLSQRGLARLLTVPADLVRGWENGTTPLYLADCSHLRALADALHSAGASIASTLGEILMASQCDLLITGMLHDFEDYGEVPPIEDDTDDGEFARALLRWALTGTPPSTGRRARARSGPCLQLLAESDIARVAGIAGRLREGASGGELASFGQALAALTQP